jgi:LacI family transcriptional regulator
VGVAVPDLVDPFFGAVVATIDAQARERGYGTLVTATGFDPAVEREVVSSLLDRRLAGLVLAPVSTDQAYLTEATASVPTVFVDQPASGVAVDAVLHDDLPGAELATRHLLEHGFRRIGFLGRAPHLASMRDRLAGYRRALEEAGADVEESLVVADVETPEDAADGYARLRRLGVDALLSADPRTTIACIPALRRDPAALVGFGDFPLADLLEPSVTVIDQDPVELGRRAATRLFRRIGGEPRAAAEERLPVALVERESCRIGQPA